MSDVSRQPLPGQGRAAMPDLRSGALRRMAADPRLFQAAVIAVVVLPAMLFYARAAADALISIVALLFLVNRWAVRDRTWVQAPHVRLLLIYWAWVIVCTLIAGTTHAVIESAVAIRLFLFAAALEFWVLAGERQRRYAYYAILVMAVWLVEEVWHQHFFGFDFVGNHVWETGVLTGPFQRARAGPTLQTIYFVAFLPPAMVLLDQPSVYRRLAGAALLIFTLLTVALIGQRMPMILVVFGLCVTGLIVKRSRVPIAAALLVLVLAVAAARVISPITYQTLVIVFLRRMAHFWSTPYAQLYQRAAVMVQMHPWIGLGYDGFRDNCNNPQYYRLLAWVPVTAIGQPAGCNLHPHNYWLQVATNSGLPGVLMFVVLCGLWLKRMGHGLFSPRATPMQVAMVVTLCTEIWPIASTTALFTIPNAGWIFLFLGWGLAEARHGPPGDDARAIR